MKQFGRFRVLIAAFFLLLPLASADAQIGRPEGLYYKSWAVIFGINDYLLAPKLTTPVADGKALAEALRKLGFEEVVEVYDKNASSKAMHHILKDVLPRKVGRQDRVSSSSPAMPASRRTVMGRTSVTSCPGMPNPIMSPKPSPWTTSRTSPGA